MRFDFKALGHFFIPSLVPFKFHALLNGKSRGKKVMEFKNLHNDMSLKDYTKSGYGSCQK